MSHYWFGVSICRKIRYGPQGNTTLKLKSSFQYKDDEKNVVRYNIACKPQYGELPSDVTIKDTFSSPNDIPTDRTAYLVNWSWNNGDWKIVRCSGYD